MRTNPNLPSTHEEKLALRDALTSGPRYVVSSEVTVVVLDEEQVRREALAKIDEVRFSDPAAAERVRADVRGDTASALSFLADPGRVLAGVAGVHGRDAGHTVRTGGATAS
ncbi:hypothetical protein [Umezawaea beigongshangensis]|uniref:hypothetical protein n=1 Tax=Umezawaea beigongshangensis TaxID=2780383 RepID=UPI0018F25FA8|nr:hypothetical protein [Umezawaea beigongshangensis]